MRVYLCVDRGQGLTMWRSMPKQRKDFVVHTQKKTAIKNYKNIINVREDIVKSNSKQKNVMIYLLDIPYKYLEYISGDELEKNCYINYDYNTMTKSKSIFRFTVFCSFLIYLYLAYKNYNKYHSLKILGKNTNIASTRVIASILVVIASSLYLTAQLNDKVSTNPSIQ